MVCKIDIGRVNKLESTKLDSIGTFIGRIGIFAVYSTRDEITVIDTSVRPRTVDGELVARTVMIIDTYNQRRKGINYRVMNYTVMDNRYRGCGIAPLVYEITAKNCGPIMSGTSQSAGGRSIWNSLTQRGKLTVAALWKGRFYSVDHSEFGEVESEDFDVYENDCRLVAA